MFINCIYIYICDILTKITLLTTQSIVNLIKLTPSYISKIKLLSTNDLIKNNKKNDVRTNNTYNKKNKICNKCMCEYNMSQECDWGWFVEIDDVYVR